MKTSELEREVFLKFLRRRKWIFVGLDLPIVLVIGCLVGLHYAFPEEEPITSIDSTLVNSMRVPPTLAAEHNSALISILIQRESAYNSQRTIEADRIWQARMFYSAIIAVLGMGVFARNRVSNPSKWILLFFIPFMYLVEVHLQDLGKRQAEVASFTTGVAVDTLLNLRSDDSTWFKLDYAKLEAQRKKASETSRLRKLRNALHPDYVQGGFYILPFLALYIFGFTGHLRSKSADNEADQSYWCSC